MKLLLVHQNYPGQFLHLQDALLARGDELAALGKGPLKGCSQPQIQRLEWSLQRGNSSDGLPLIRDLESKFIRAEAAGIAAECAARQGYKPDIIIAHPGWGETLFLADIWPDVPQLHYLEFDYSLGLDMHFDPEFPVSSTWQERARQRVKSSNMTLGLQSMTWGMTPTRFQWSSLPRSHQANVSIIHDGINVQTLHPDDSAELDLGHGVRLGSVLKGAAPVLTFVNRTFEPYRGVHRLLRALPALQQRHPNLQTLLIGRNTPSVSYGSKRSDGRGWLTVMREELGASLDWSRIHTPGHLNYSQYIKSMQLSAAHVYFTYPFVLSWSLLESMACGAPVIGSATPPVEEVIEHGVNGVLVDFFNQDALIESVSQCLHFPHEAREMGLRARQTVMEHYDLDSCRQRQIQLIDAVANGLIGARL